MTLAMIRKGEWGWVDVEDYLVGTAHRGSDGRYC
jgi:hypothetical protein